ncbi:MAG: ATP-binding cassette domain-containing protein [Mycobacteriales bacterium]
MSVRALVGEPLRLARAPRRAHGSRVRQAMERVGLDPTPELLAGNAQRLSGGQRQRVAIARALVGAAALLVADEPTSMLDAALRAEIAAVLRALAEDGDCGILLITHDLGEASKLCDRIVVLDHGRVRAEGPPAQVPR